MILERMKSKNDETVIRRDGRYLASSVSAVREAEQWLVSHHAQLQGVEVAIVLGVGCGYHLSALTRKYPSLKVVAIDCQEELIEIAKVEHAIDLLHVQFICATDLKSIIVSEIIKKALPLFYTVLNFAPAQAGAERLYSDIEEFICGRVHSGLSFLLHVRGESFAPRLVCVDAHPRSQLLSIKDILNSDFSSSDTKTRSYLMALRELVV